uniref:hypothetical protein n=1 Tax=Cysteiniphilum litorale TaxID=2056700 RepID=UPI003F8856DF
MLDCLDSCVDSSRPLLPSSIGDSNIKLNESQTHSNKEENEDDLQQAYDDLYTFTLELEEKNKRLIEESKKLNKQLDSSNDELREKEEVINCVDSKFLISLNNLYIVQDELKELKMGYDNINKENLKLKDLLKEQCKLPNTSESELIKE